MGRLRTYARLRLIWTAAVSLALIAGSLPAGAHPVRNDLAVATILALPVADRVQLDQAGSAASEASTTEQRYPWTFERSSLDRPDQTTGRMLHVVYLVAAGMPDDHYDELGVI